MDNSFRIDPPGNDTGRSLTSIIFTFLICFILIDSRIAAKLVPAPEEKTAIFMLIPS
jgi:hypothetical protein